MKHQRTIFIKQLAAQLGFSYCGIAHAQKLDEDARRLESWLQQGMNGQMQYMANHFDLRVDPTRLVPGAQSVITLLLNYYPAEKQRTDAPQISKYAYGKDYHELIRSKLNLFMQRLREEIGQVEGRGFVDSAPVLERTWARRSGLGWIGKNGNLITRQQGSFFFIATLICDLELEYDDAMARDYCGSCRRCIDACPTEAILPNKVIDGSRCISYFTIELKEMLIPDSMQGKFKDWIFGCDICQDVCPWNRFSRPHQEEGLNPLHEIISFSLHDWQNLTEESFKQIFKHSPIKRSKYAGLMRNLRFVYSGQQQKDK